MLDVKITPTEATVSTAAPDAAGAAASTVAAAGSSETAGRDTTRIDNRVLGDIAIARGVLERYLAYLQGVQPERMWPEVSPTERCGFRDAENRVWSLRFEIVPLEHMCSAPANNSVRETMTRMIHALHVVSAMLLDEIQTRVAAGELTLARPELFMGSRMAITPHTTAFLYNDRYGNELHSTYADKIGFVWAREAANNVAGETADAARV